MIPEEDLLEDVRNVAEILGCAPSTREYGEHGDYSSDTVRRRFGGWCSAVQEATPKEARAWNAITLTDEEVLEFLRELSDELGRRPRWGDFDQSPIDAHFVSSRFGSFDEALAEAGFVAAPSEFWYTEEELLEEIHRLTEDDTPPLGVEMEEVGRYSQTAYKKRFGSFNKAVEEAGYTPVRRSGISDDVLFAELQSFYDEYGESPTIPQFDGYSEYSSGALWNRFGSWDEALEAAGLPPHKWDERERADEYGENWDEIREMCLERDDYRCKLCGMTEEEHREWHSRGSGLHVHHIRPLAEFDSAEEANALDNLVTLCISCHQPVEYGMFPTPATERSIRSW